MVANKVPGIPSRSMEWLATPLHPVPLVATCPYVSLGYRRTSEVVRMAPDFFRLGRPSLAFARPFSRKWTGHTGSYAAQAAWHWPRQSARQLTRLPGDCNLICRGCGRRAVATSRPPRPFQGTQASAYVIKTFEPMTRPPSLAADTSKEVKVFPRTTGGFHHEARV